MEAEILTEIGVSLLILGLIWFVGFASLRREKFRNDIRRMRDELFDYMWENGHSFEDVNYVETRHALNGILRCSNSINPVTFLTLVALNLRYGTSENELSIDSMPSSPLKNELERVMRRAVHRLTHFLFWEGSFKIVTLAVLAFAKLIEQAASLKCWVNQQVKSMLGDFSNFGEQGSNSVDRPLIHA